MKSDLSELFSSSENLNILWASLIIEECYRNGIRCFCVSPGSRSTPLALALARSAEHHPDIETVICVDERAAAFHALGYARATRIPSALICTSGTAVANYLPAVIEAAQDDVPMLLLTADRPPELRDNGANQAIQQPNIFGNYVRWQFDVPCPSEEISPSFILSTIDHAYFRAINIPNGAVHVNCMFREPLAPSLKPFAPNYLQPLQNWLQNSSSFTHYVQGKIIPAETTVRNIAQILDSAKSPLICVGRLATREERDAVMQCAYMWRIPIVADIASGLRLHDVPNTIPYFDQILLKPEILDSMKPDVVFHIGGSLVSKRIREWLLASAPRQYIHLEDTPFRHDPNNQITMRVQGNIIATMNMLYKTTDGLHTESSLAVAAFRLSEIIEKELEKSIEINDSITETAAAMLVSRHIPSDSGLFLSNSMPIRDMDMYALTQHESGYIHVGTNRGASGIDGILATASGFARGLKKPVTLMIGDLALIHDLNSSLLAADSTAPLIIIAINNNGGGIFSFLPIAEKNNSFEKFWGTPQGVQFAAISHFAGISYESVGTVKEFEKAYKQAIKNATSKEPHSSMIEISINREENVQAHKNLQSSIISLLKS